ncbi:uncharacterized protein C15orf39 homolog [Syngnathus typhle]|uniref:uncharacterized protein C15orf39 homolog n=1 Tax=Syngnathus typhle TaxID=161592 RepID=UPI002A6B206A|nr:uncharacterized protein C15orf39 homolog [Syngnathus typhle]XP_061139582.1 uncharacterized protein C15orf39 homolog [Syngnathus typhle]
MPLFDESVVFAGLPKSSDMSGFIVKPVFPYGGAHFSYHPRGKDAAEFTAPWTNASAASPTHRASGVKTGGDNSSLPDSPVYLAIPKALYLHNPCCHDLACVMRHRYNMEHGQTAALNADLERNRPRGEPYRSPRSGIHQTARDNPRDLQSDSCEGQIERMTAESLSGGGRPSRTEPNYGGYPCMPPLATLAPLSEQSRHLQPPPRGFAAFPPPTHMTSELYQECSPMSKYGHPTKQPMFYYPQANVEVERRTHGRDIGGEQREDVPGIRTSAIPSPGEYYTFPPTLQGDIPLFFHGTETQPNHSFVHGLGYRCYAHPGFQIRNVEQQHAPTGLPSHRLVFRGSDQRPSAAAASVGLEKSEQHVGPSEPSHVLLRVEPISPTGPVCQSVLPPHSLYPSITSRLDHQMVISPSGMTQDRPLDFSSYVSQIKPEHRKVFPVSPRTRLPQSPKQTSDCMSKLERLMATDQVDEIACDYVLKDSLKRRFPSRVKVKVEEPDPYEIDLTPKRRKSDTKRNRGTRPQMPVIRSVFSLAQEYLNPPEVEPQRGAQLADHFQIIPTTALKGTKPDPNGAPRCTCPEKCEVQMMEPTKIKVEKINQSDTCGKSPSPAASGAIRDQIKPQPEDATLSDTKSMLATQVREPEKLLSVEVNDASQRPKAPGSLENDKTLPEQMAEAEPKPLKAADFDITSIPLDHLNLCPSYDIRLHRPAAQQEAPAQIQAETSPVPQAAVRKRFLELHRTLCKRVSKRVSATSEQQLTTWRSQLELAEPSSNKVQNVSSLLGTQARDEWLNEEIHSALEEVLDRFREYIIHERCPFPHVMRTGAVFLPMLVVKEILFPEVPVTFIDQVLHEHKVQLRPTTLSEEKILTQLHKPCSSRLKRLMSLKHLPDVYADVLNLLYYSNVCKHLDSTSSDVQKTSQE